MRTITLELYTFNELSEKIQEKVLNEMRYFETDFDWWKQEYEDAEQIGLKITGFDLDRRGTITGRLIWTAKEVAEAIIENHGETCDTYKTAKYFLDVDIPKVDGIYAPDGTVDERDYADVIDEFQDKLLAHYLEMLRADYEYITSDEGVKEMIEANGYEFFVNGERYNKNKFGGE